MKDSSIAGSKPTVTDHQDATVNDQCVEYQAMTNAMETFVVVSRKVADQFAPTGGPKVVLKRNQNDWLSNDSWKVIHEDNPLYGIYISCTADAQKKTGYRMIKYDCGKAQDFTHIDEMSIKIQEALQVFSVAGEKTRIKADDLDDLCPYDFPLDSQNLVYIDELYSLSPHVAEETAERIYERFELLYVSMERVHDQEYLNANLSLVFCLPTETPIEVIRLLCRYFEAV